MGSYLQILLDLIKQLDPETKPYIYTIFDALICSYLTDRANNTVDEGDRYRVYVDFTSTNLILKNSYSVDKRLLYLIYSNMYKLNTDGNKFADIGTDNGMDPLRFIYVDFWKNWLEDVLFKNVHKII